jgi:hypothetical protein
MPPGGRIASVQTFTAAAPELGVLECPVAEGLLRSAAHCLDRLDEVLPSVAQAPTLFPDYDGTLTPSVAHPEEAVRLTLRRVCTLRWVVVISGHDLGDVRDRCRRH